MDNNDDKSIDCAVRLRKLRESFKLNQVNFSKKLGFSNSYLCDMEAGDKNISANVLKKLAQVFDINPSWLLLEHGPKFLNNGKKQGKAPEITGDNSSFAHDGSLPDPELDKLIYYYNNSPFVKHSLMGFFYQLLKRNKDIIEEDIDNKKSTGKR